MLVCFIVLGTRTRRTIGISQTYKPTKMLKAEGIMNETRYPAGETQLRLFASLSVDTLAEV